MPLAAKTLSEFYYQFGTMVQAGVSIQKALDSLRRTAPPAMRQHVVAMSLAIEAGEPLHEALAQQGKQFAALDQQTLAISGQSGALEIGLLSLSKYYEARAKARKRILSASFFPAVLLIAAVFIGRLPQLVLGELGQTSYGAVNFVVDTFGFLAALVAIGLIARAILKQLLQTPRLNVTVSRLLHRIPLFGRVQFDYALSQWIASIRLMLKAGFAIHQALEYASKTTPSPLIADAYEKACVHINSQMDVSAALESTGVFPNELIQFWATGEQSGKMDEMLDRLARIYEERWNHSLDILAAWLPRIAYAFVSLYIIYQIVVMLAPIIGIYKEALQQ